MIEAPRRIDADKENRRRRILYREEEREKRRLSLITAQRLFDNTLTANGLKKQIFGDNWREAMQCAEKGDALFVEGEKAQEKAKKICNGCPVRIECLTDALIRNSAGVWGGTTEKERKNIKRRGRTYVKRQNKELITTLKEWRQERRVIFIQDRAKAQ